MSEHPTDVDRVLAELREQGVDVVRISYADMIGIDRGRDILLEELPAARHHGLGFCRATFHTTPQGDVVPIPGGLDAGLPDVNVVPDLTTLAPLPWAPGTAWALAEVFELDGSPFEESPRHLLARVEDRLAEVGLRGVVGPELEYFLLEPDASAPSGWRRYGDAPGNVYVVGAKGDPSGHLLKTLRLLRDAGLAVSAANHEFCGGQFEINLKHSAGLDAADRAFRLKSSIQEIARLDGLQATFMAKPFNDEGGSGFHLHLSLVDDAGRNVIDDPDGEHGLSTTAHQAIAGILAHAPALSALLNPTINSYKRFGPDTLAPWLIDWGLDNRSAMLRVPAERGETTRLELRLGDASANPYLGIAGLIGATYLGIRDRIEPPRPSAGYGYDPSKAPTLPATLSDALAYLEEDTAMVEVLGKDFVRSYVDFKWEEVARFQRFVTDWEFTEYAYHL